MDMINITALIQSNPKLWIVIFSLAVTILITIVTYFFTDKELMKNIKSKQKSLKEEMKAHKDNPQKMMELNKKMMEDMPAQMKQSLKVSVITLIPLLIFFGWLRSTFATTTIASSWIWWYIISSLVFSIAIRKVFKLD